MWQIIDPQLPEFGVSQEMTSPDPRTTRFTGIAFGNGVFVAVGQNLGEDSFRWAASKDGAVWKGHSQKLAVGTTFTTSKVHFIDRKFVFFGEHKDDGFHVHSSADGITWKDTKLTTTGVREIVDEFDGSDSLTVYAGNNGSMESSPDLVTWTPRTDVARGIFDFLDIAYGAGRWVATGNGGAQTWGSDDGVSWTALDDSLKSFRIEFGGGVWLATAGGGVMQSSNDGKTFSVITPTPLDRSPGWPPRFAGGRFITSTMNATNGNIMISFSKDGAAWTDFGEFAPVEKRAGDASVTVGMLDLAYGNCRYVFAGDLVFRPPPTPMGPNVWPHRALIITADLSK